MKTPNRKLAAAVVAALAASAVQASSHREAPAITRTAGGRRNRLLHVQELRARTGRLRHAHRQLPAAPGPLRRAQLLRARRPRPVRDPHRPGRRCARRPDLPVPVPQPARRPPARASRSTIGGKSVAVPLKNIGPVSAGDRSFLNFRGVVLGAAGPRRPAHRQRGVPAPGRRRLDVLRQALRLRGHQDLRQRGRLRGLRAQLHLRGDDSELQCDGPRVRRPA